MADKHPTETETPGLERHDEVWRDLPDYEGVYLISNYGRVLRRDKGRMMTAYLKKKHGYAVCVSALGVSKVLTVARETARAFISPPPSPQHVVVHVDGDKSNNHVSNLCWVHEAKLIHHFPVKNPVPPKEPLTAKQIASIKSLAAAGRSFSEIKSETGHGNEIIYRYAPGLNKGMHLPTAESGYVTMAEACRILGRTRSYILWRRKKIDMYKIGHAWHISRTWVEEERKRITSDERIIN